MSTSIVVVHSCIGMVLACVRLIANDSTVPSIPAKNVVCHREETSQVSAKRVQTVRIYATHNGTYELQPVEPDLDNVHDRLAFRIVVPGCGSCRDSTDARFLLLLASGVRHGQ